MSDYRPPDAEKNITDMLEECIRLILLPLPLSDLMKAGRVCKLWNTLQKSVCLTKKSLIILIGKDTTLDFLRSTYNHQFSLENVLDADGKPMEVDTLERNYVYSGLEINNLTVAKIASLFEIFANVTQLTIGCEEASPKYINQVVRLLTKFSDQLIVLNMTLEYKHLPEKHQKSLYDVINGMPNLKHLGLKIHLSWNHETEIHHFDLPILCQLEQLDLSIDFDGPSPSISQHWAPHLKERAEPLRIAYTCGPVDQADLARIPPKTAAMFSRLPLLSFEDSFKLSCFTAKFSNLVAFSVSTFTIPVPRLLAAFANLKKLISLTVFTHFPPAFDHAAHQVLFIPQLPSVKLFTLNQNQSSHADITRWNLSRSMPNLQLLYITNHPKRCTDCNFNSDTGTYEQFKQCYHLQMRSLKQQCPSLRAAELSWPYGIRSRLEDITD